MIIKSVLFEYPIPLSVDYPVCHVCLREIAEGYCACDDPVDPAYLEDAEAWLDAGVSAHEMARAAIVLEELGTKRVAKKTRFDERLGRTDVMLWGFEECPILHGAAGDVAELAAAMAVKSGK